MTDECKKLKISVLGKRMTYRAAFMECNKKAHKGAICMVLNSDVALDDAESSAFRTLRAAMFHRHETDAHGHTEHRSVAYALSRWERRVPNGLAPLREYATAVVPPNGTAPQPSKAEQSSCPAVGIDLCPLYRNKKGFFLSHDAFMFVSPVPDSLVKSLDFLPNLPGAENVVVHEMRHAGMRVFNPCFSLRLFHRHCIDLAAPQYGGGAGDGLPSHEPRFRHAGEERLDLKRCKGKYHCGNGYVYEGPTTIDVLGELRG